jgi:hypothetical protein
MRWPKVISSSIMSLGLRAARALLFDEDSDVVAIDFDAGCRLCRDRGRLVRRALKHGREAEDVAVARFVDDNLLAVLVFDGDVHRSGEDNVGAPAVFAGFIDALAGCEFAQFDLGGENAEFVVIEQGEERDVAEFFWGAGHDSRPRKYCSMQTA